MCMLWEVVPRSTLFRSSASARMSWMVKTRATRSRSPHEAGAYSGSRAEKWGVGLSEFWIGNSVSRRSSWARVLMLNPLPHGFQIIRGSRTVGTDEGRDLPPVIETKFEKNGEGERTSRKERAVRSRDAHCAPLAQRPFMRSSSRSWNHRERRVGEQES